jgi:transcriptional regulator with XRE-family HTH domain
MRQNLADQIRAAVRASAETRRSISNRAGIHEANLSHFMSGRQGLSIQAIEMLAEVLGLVIRCEKAEQSISA